MRVEIKQTEDAHHRNIFLILNLGNAELEKTMNYDALSGIVKWFISIIFLFYKFHHITKLMGIILRAYEHKNGWMVECDETPVDIDVLAEEF